MGLNGVGLAERNIDVAAVRLPARLAGGVVLVGVGDAPVVLFAELVFGGIGIGIAAQPELLDERLALLIVAQVLESLPFVIGDDVGHILLEPVLVGVLQFPPDLFPGGEPLLVGALALERVWFLRLSGGGLGLGGRAGGLLGGKPGGAKQKEAATECDDKERWADGLH